MAIYSNTYYSNKKTQTTPYCYLIRHKPSGLCYYGSRYCNGADPSKLFVDYFTSSKLIKTMLQIDGVESFEWEIRKTFESKQKCVEWESKVLSKLNVECHPLMLNLDSKQKSHKAIQNNIKTTSISNSQTGQCIRYPDNKPIPDGWYYGNINMKGKHQNKRKWIYRISDGKAFHVPELFPLPIGYSCGRGCNYKSNSIFLKNKNTIWITDGINTVLFNANDVIPENWKRGRSLKNRPSGKRKTKYIWITNKTESTQIPFDNDIPNGWYRGRTFNPN